MINDWAWNVCKTFYYSPVTNFLMTINFELTATIDQEMRKLFEIPDNVETRLWNRYTANTYEQLAKLDATVQDTGLYSGQPILIEKQNPDGSWPRQQKRYCEQYFKDAKELLKLKTKNIIGVIISFIAQIPLFLRFPTMSTVM